MNYFFMNNVKSICFQDLHLIDLEEFKYAGTNMTSFRLVDPNNLEVQVYWQSDFNEISGPSPESFQTLFLSN